MRFSLGAQDGGDSRKILAKLADSLQIHQFQLEEYKYAKTEIQDERANNYLDCQEKFLIGPPGVNSAGWVG